MTENAFSQLVKNFGEIIGMPDLMPDEEGGVIFSLDDQITVNIELNPVVQAVIIFCPVHQFAGEVPVLAKDILLDGNFFFQDTAGATLGLKRGSRIVVLAEQFALSTLSAADLVAHIERVASEALRWRQTLEGIEQASNSERQHPQRGMRA